MTEQLCVVNMLKAPKHCFNLDDSIFLIFFDHSDRESALKIQSYYYLESSDCLLRYWHPMKSSLSQ